MKTLKFILLTSILCLFSSSASAQSGEWNDWLSARYFWDLDREDIDGQRARNGQVRLELRLAANEYQANTSMLSPVPVGTQLQGPVVRAPNTTARTAAPVRPRVIDTPVARPSRADVAARNATDRQEQRRRDAIEAKQRAAEAKKYAADKRATERRLAREEKARRAEEARDRKERDQRARKLEKERQREEARRLAEQDRIRREEQKRAEFEAARKEELRKKEAAAQAKRKKEEQQRKKKLRDEKNLRERTDTRGQVIDDEINDLLDEELEDEDE